METRAKIDCVVLDLCSRVTGSGGDSPWAASLLLVGWTWIMVH